MVESKVRGANFGGANRREMPPVERLREDVAKYAEAVLYALGAEYRAMADVRAARSVSIGRVNRILRRSSADALAPMVLSHMVERGLVKVDAGVIHFLPDLIAYFEDERVGLPAPRSNEVHVGAHVPGSRSNEDPGEPRG